MAKALGSLRPYSDDELEQRREAIRLRNIAGNDRYDELRRYDAEMTRPSNEAYDREHPDPPTTRHREHGWYLPNDD
ncbi:MULTISPECIES: hypothetical protein [unclassified Curtobacterium]|uniref:hypothetical protein n=1 Tax=unclassified Curtobacterium TaxID=257496 RepID=UPI001910A2C6|nr:MULTISPECIES: hypothetical protein [unclassified Curtobacterium]